MISIVGFPIIITIFYLHFTALIQSVQVYESLKIQISMTASFFEDPEPLDI